MLVDWERIGNEPATERQRVLIERLYELLDWKLPLRFDALTRDEAGEYIRAGYDACQYRMERNPDGGCGR